MKKFIVLIICSVILLNSNIALADITSSRDEGEFKEYRIQVEINKGWNLVAGIGDPNLANFQTSDISIGNLKYIWAFYPNLQAYGFTHPKIEESKRSSLSLEDFRSMGFWVYSDKKGMLDFYTDHFKNFDQRTIYQGWNFLAVTPEFMGYSLDQLKGNCKIESAYAFDVTGQAWLSFGLKDQIFGEYDEGRAIVIKAANACKLGSYTEGSEIAAPPTMPASYGTECKDSDSGKDYYTQGSTTKGSIQSIDGCNLNGAFGSNPNVMREYFCSEEGEIAGEWYDCPNGCSNGACI